MGGQGPFLVPLGVPRGVKNAKILNFEPIRQVRGVFASILGADFNREVKTLIFGPFWGGQCPEDASRKPTGLDLGYLASKRPYLAGQIWPNLNFQVTDLRQKLIMCVFVVKIQRGSKTGHVHLGVENAQEPKYVNLKCPVAYAYNVLNFRGWIKLIYNKIT